MKTQSKHCIAAAVMVIATMLPFWMLSMQATSLAEVFDSPLAVPTPMGLTFRSPLLNPTLDPALAPSGPRVPQELPSLRTPEPRSPLPGTFMSPLAAPTLTLEPQSYLPAALRNYPMQLLYGPRGLAGTDSFGLFSENYNAYYTWGVNPSRSDARFARMVFCVDDYHLYTEGIANQIVQAAQSDAGNVIGRVWLVFNEPVNTYGEPLVDAQCGRYALEGDPHNPDPSTWVANNPADAAIRYSMVYDWIKNGDPNAKVFAGGLLETYAAKTRNWWTTFVNTLSSRGELHKIEGVHIHSYPAWSTGWGCVDHDCMPEMAQQLNMWYDSYHVGLGLGDRPIWITEIGAGPFCNRWERWNPQGWLTIRDSIMKPMSWWFTGDPQWPHSSVPTNPGYDSIHWYTPWIGSEEYQVWWCDFLEDGRSSPAVLTPLGEHWLSYDLDP